MGGLDPLDDIAYLRGEEHDVVPCSRGLSTRQRTRKTQVSPRAAADACVPDLLEDQDTTDVRDLKWRCMDGRVLCIGEMETRHLFNACKMLFNHLAEAQGGVPVWFTRKYADYQAKARGDLSDLREMALLVCVFACEIDLRGDLPRQYWEPFFAMLAQMRPTPRMAEARLLLNGGTTDGSTGSNG